MALTTADLRSMLRGAWSDDFGGGELLAALKRLEKDARDAVSGGQIAASSANGRSISLSGSSPYGITSTETARGFDELIRLYNKARRFLYYCFQHGVDPVNVEAYGSFTANEVISNPPNVLEKDVYEWLMGSEEVGNMARFWPGQLLEITESRGDYGAIRTAQGQQFV